MNKPKQYINASLSCPDAAAEIIEDNPDEMKIRVICPYCGQETTYGETLMISGYVGCPNCYWDEYDGLRAVVEKTKENSYGDYLSGNFYRRGFRNWRVKNG